MPDKLNRKGGLRERFAFLLLNAERTWKHSLWGQNSYAEILSSFHDDLQTAVDDALQHYLIDEIAARIAKLKKKELLLQQKYGCDYKTFARRTTEDEKYIDTVEKTISKLWENDLTDWEFCAKWIEDWTRRLQNILLLS